MRKLLVLVGLVSAAALSTVAAAQAGVVTHTYNVPISFTTSNPCNGELVPVTGNEDIMIRMTTAGNGSVKIGEHVSFDLSGVGATTGANYNVNEILNVEENNVTFVNGATEVTETAHLSFIAQGNVPNFKEHLIIHETITPAGDITSFKFDDSSTCQ